ncbi:pilus assembly PilX family protein [Cellulomonas dongxiuzhuiae]|nr:hypothetical protein [Cellulomonas dongxiuzhuiae]
MRLMRTRLGARHDDTGAGLVLVVGSMMVLTMLALTALASVTASERLARHSQDYQAAAAAAQAGVEEFISRVNREDSYGSTIDCLNPAWRAPTTTANSCGWNAATTVGWAPVVPGETDPAAAWFHYSVDASRKTAEGSILLTVTGRVNGVYRTVETAVGKGGSTDYVYYTDFESADPANIQAYTAAEKASMSAAQRNACGINGHSNALYWWKKNAANQTRSSYGCEEITFIDGDRLDGQVHTNDTIFASIRTSGAPKPSFLEPVTTSDERCRTPGTTNSQWEDRCLRPSTNSLNGLANFNSKPPSYKDPLYLDDTSAEFVNHPGCHYYGSTRVIFRSNGRMTVWNKRVNNNNTAPVSIAAPDGTQRGCGTLDQLDAGADLEIPDDMVLYVGASSAPMRECYKGEIGGPTGRALPLGTYTGAAAGSGGTYQRDVNMEEPTKACSRGNLYAEGIVNGHVTLAAAESVIVTGDLVLADGRTEGSSDLLGLVATNSVEVFHPRMVTVNATRNYVGAPWYWGNPSGESDPSTDWPTRYTDPTTSSYFPSSGVQIAGSIQTLQHSFLVQKHSVGGALGTLYVYGSIAQRWRGIVGQGTNGYTKSYNYDKRLRYASPPYFPRWANAEWSLRYTGETTTPDEVRT